jgi:arginyl-tRNA--protein-N-Asp/Glu arginylyltransferase
MSPRDAGQFVAIHFYATAPYSCSYLADAKACSQVATPAEAIDSRVYSQLIRLGFRRSGMHTYRPHCQACQACVPVRIPVAAFTPNRSQQRAWRKHQQLSVRQVPLVFSEEHYQLYHRYQRARHQDGGMAEDDPQLYAGFVLKSGVETWLVEFRAGDQLKMVSLIDRLDDSLSAVYTFYEPDDVHASYGSYSVLWQVAQAQRLGLSYLYLGYWIASSRKMSYKSGFKPLEKLQAGDWLPFE